jgi:protein TonB
MSQIHILEGFYTFGRPIQDPQSVSTEDGKSAVRAGTYSAVHAEAQDYFSSSFIITEHRPLLHRLSTAAGSLVVHTIFVSVAVLAPMWFTNALDIKSYTKTLLLASPPPPAPRAHYRDAENPATHAAARRNTFGMQGKLLFPRAIPKQVAMINDGPSAVDPAGEIGGVLGGVPGAPFGGILGDILESATPPAPLPPPPAVEQPKVPVRVGPHVQPPRIIHRVEPVYPALAKQARVEGNVVISVIIDTKGNVVEMKTVSGNPLLLKSALDAVQQWRYEPTLLKGQPVDIDMTITVTFTLGG